MSDPVKPPRIIKLRHAIKVLSKNDEKGTWMIIGGIGAPFATPIDPISIKEINWTGEYVELYVESDHKPLLFILSDSSFIYDFLIGHNLHVLQRFPQATTDKLSPNQVSRHRTWLKFSYFKTRDKKRLVQESKARMRIAETHKAMLESLKIPGMVLEDLRISPDAHSISLRSTNAQLEISGSRLRIKLVSENSE